MLLALSLLPALAGATRPELDSGRESAASLARPELDRSCASVVIKRCEPSAELGRGAETERRRIDAQTVDFGKVIIEGRRERPPSVEQRIADALRGAPAASLGATTTREVGDGRRCTCLDRCPPPPFPCCQCTAASPDRPSAY